MASAVTVEHSVTSDGGLAPVRLGWAEGLLTALVLVWFGRCAGYGFLLWDDQAYIVANPLLPGVTLDHLRAIFTPGAVPGERLYLPLTYLTLMGGQPAGWVHATNVLLHAANAVLVLWLARRLFVGQALAAFLVAALFAVHPLQVESVAWALSRKDVLSGFFVLTALVAYQRWLLTEHKRWYGVALGAAALALLAKPTAVVLPVFLVLLDAFHCGRVTARAWLQKVPFLALSVAAWRLNAGLEPGGAGLVWQGQVLQLAYVPAVVTGWLARLLLFDRPNPQYLTATLDPAAIGALACVPLLLALLALRHGLRTDRRQWFGWLFAAAALLPAAGVLLARNRDCYTADRYGYLALVGAGVTLAALAYPPPGARSCGCCGGALRALLLPGFVVWCAVRAWPLVGVWADTPALATYLLARQPQNHLAHDLLGNARATAGDFAGAMPHYRAAAAARPDYATAWHNLALASRQTGDPAAAAVAAQRAALARHGWAHCAWLAGQRHEAAAAPEAAAACYRDASAFHRRWVDGRGYAPALVAAARLATARGVYAEAAAACLEAVTAEPERAAAWDNLGHVRMLQGQPGLAVTPFARAVQLRPAVADAHFKLGQALLLSGDPAAAVPEFEAALRLDRNLAAAHEALVHACLGTGDLARARTHATACRAAGRPLPADVEARLAPPPLPAPETPEPPTP